MLGSCAKLAKAPSLGLTRRANVLQLPVREGGRRTQLKLTDAYLLKWKSTKNIIATISIFLKVVAFSSLVQQF